MKESLTDLIQKRSRLLVVVHDIIIIAAAWSFAYWLQSNVIQTFTKGFCATLPLILLVQSFICFSFGLYRGVWRFASIPDMIRILKAVLIGALVLPTCFFFFRNLPMVPRAIFLIYSMSLFLFLGIPRLLYRWVKDRGYFILSEAKKVLVVGAGVVGEGFIRNALRNRQGYSIIALVDDNPLKQGSELHGVRVIGKISDIPTLVKKHRIDLIVLAIPSAKASYMQKIIELCESTNATFRTLPSLADITSGKININHLREVSIEDLLGREPVNLDWQNIQLGINDKTILVTGGAGSIGTELCLQIGYLGPKSLIIIENSEYNLYLLEMKLKEKFPTLLYYLYLTSVTERNAIKEIITRHKPDIVFHAAAYKHVPILENQIRAAVLNNFIGTVIMAEESALCLVDKFVLISTDKAVNPKNIMGATKRAAEIFCKDINQYTKTQFITTRFGNVLGSQGSVVPLFKKQLEKGGPITVTHPDITRYFMTIPEAVQLILQTTVMGKGGEIYVLDMGQPIKITYLAEQLIRLAGKTPYHDIDISYIGLRPGEKLYETLFYKNEKLIDTPHEKIYRAQYVENIKDTHRTFIKQLRSHFEANNVEELTLLLKTLMIETSDSVAHNIKPFNDYCTTNNLLSIE